MRRHDHERDDERDPGARGGERGARIAVEQQEQSERRRQHDHEIFRPQREAEGDAEQQPVDHASAPQGGMEGVAGERPQRQLDHVVIELGGGEMEVVHAVENEDGDERADGAHQRASGQPNHRKGRHHRDLRQRVVGGVDPDHPVDEFHQPPRQRRQLVVTELPFAAIGQRLDEIERQIGIEQRRQRGPDDNVQRQEHGEGRLRTTLDGGDQFRHRMGRCLEVAGSRSARSGVAGGLITAAGGGGIGQSR